MSKKLTVPCWSCGKPAKINPDNVYDYCNKECLIDILIKYDFEFIIGRHGKNYE